MDDLEGGRAEDAQVTAVAVLADDAAAATTDVDAGRVKGRETAGGFLAPLGFRFFLFRVPLGFLPAADEVEEDLSVMAAEANAKKVDVGVHLQEPSLVRKIAMGSRFALGPSSHLLLRTAIGIRRIDAIILYRGLRMLVGSRNTRQLGCSCSYQKIRFRLLVGPGRPVEHRV